MPYRSYREKPWHCSWECGYKHIDLRKVFNHENEKHPAIETAPLQNPKQILRSDLIKRIT